MIYSGTIRDAKGAPIPGASVSFVTDTGETRVSFPVDAAGHWSLDSEFDGDLLQPGIVARFSAPGFTYYGISAPLLQPTFDVTLAKKVSPVLYLGLGAAAAIMISSRGKKRVAGIKSEDVRTGVYIVGGIIIISVLTKGLQKLQIFDSPEKKKLDQTVSDPGSYWTPNYWQNINPSGTGWAFSFTEQQAKDWLTNLINNTFGVIYDSPENALAIFKQLRTKANVSYMAYVLQQWKSQDLLTLLRNGGGWFPWDGLSDANVTLITNYTDSLPDY